MKRVGYWGLVIALGLVVACKKADPSTPKYWEKLLDSRKNASAAMTRIGSELKTPEQKKWGAKLVLKYWDRSPGTAAVALGKLGYADPSAIDKLIGALKSNEPLLMANAAAALRKLGGTKAVPALIEILDKWTPKNPRQLTVVRKEVTKALGKLGGRDAVPVLVKTAQERSHGLIVNLLAMQALGKIGDPRAIPALVWGLYLSCPGDRCSAAARIGLNRMGKRAVPALLKVVRRKHPVVEKLAKIRKLKEGQITAVPFMVLGDVGDPATARKLADEYLGQESSFTRVNAISAIGHTGGPDLVNTLTRAYGKSLLEGRVNILHALHRIGSRRAIKFLRKQIRKPDDPNLMWTAGLALSYLGDEGEIGLMDKVIKQAAKEQRKYRGERRMVAKQTVVFFKQFKERLAAARNCDSAGCWRKKLKSPRKQVRIKAARMLAFAGGSRKANEDALIAALADPDPDVRSDVYFALSKIGTRRAVKPLVERIRKDKGKRGMRQPLFLYKLLAARLKARAGE